MKSPCFPTRSLIEFKATARVMTATDTSLTLLQQGIRQQTGGNLLAAEAHYRKVRANSPFYSDALNLLGTVQAHRGNSHEAALLMEKAIRSNPHNVTA